jgi:hypothetical protein
LGRTDYLILIGAPKCGTTSLSAWLGGLPGVCLTRVNEPRYFTDHATRAWNGPGGARFGRSVVADPVAFEDLFADKEAGLRVEASTDNLSCPATLDRLKAHARRDDVGRVRLVALLRDPVDRIVSEYEHTLQLGFQRGSLMRSLKAETARTAQGWHPLFRHLERSRYHSQLAPFRQAFGEDLMILDYHRIQEPATLRKVASFAGIDLPEGAALTLPHRNKRRVLARPWLARQLRTDTPFKAALDKVPGRFRPHLLAWLSGPERPRYEASASEIAFIQDALADEIAACLADPGMPTDNWKQGIEAKSRPHGGLRTGWGRARPDGSATRAPEAAITRARSEPAPSPPASRG